MNEPLDIAKFQQINEENIKAGKEVDEIRLKLDGEYGSASDIAILSFSPKETTHGQPTFLSFLRKISRN